MKRVMMLVLPTDWSPKNTSLYFAKADTGAIFLISKREERLSKVLERIWLGFGFGFDSIWEMKWERERVMVSANVLNWILSELL